MTLDRLIEEISARARRELEETEQRAAQEEQATGADRDRRVAALQAEGRRTAEIDGARERAQRLAGAKLQGRKLVYAAEERKTGERLEEVRSILRDFTQSSDYPQVLKRMFAFAISQLGKQLRVTGRPEDASTLKTVAGKSFDPSPASILGGLVAETPDGTRRLNLSFDELLRLREDEVRAILAS